MFGAYLEFRRRLKVADLLRHLVSGHTVDVERVIDALACDVRESHGSREPVEARVEQILEVDSAGRPRLYLAASTVDAWRKAIVESSLPVDLQHASRVVVRTEHAIDGSKEDFPGVGNEQGFHGHDCFLLN